MPSIVEYDRVLKAMAEQGLICQYYNSGAFGFGKGVPIYYTGWLGPEDPSIRPEARRMPAYCPPVPAPWPGSPPAPGSTCSPARSGSCPRASGATKWISAANPGSPPP